MRLIADLHIHSRYSRATSSKLTPARLDRWAGIKGIGLLGTGDCTHPKWLSELRENLEDAEPGLYTLKKDIRAAFDSGAALAEELPRPGTSPLNDTPRFMLSGEISTIYKRNGRTRKVHHLILLPDFSAAARFQTKLEKVGNISSDGRPILGVDSRDLLAMLMETDDRSILIPAHIWTPWFSALGAQSGFDSIEECYGDLASCIPAVETGLSSDPPMNWRLSSLDRYAIVSNSDAHSPDKLGREATIFDTELSYAALREALFCNSQTDGCGIIGTVEFFPEEGKYHYDGHRKCGVCLGPEETVSGEKICPVCGKALTRGVMGRVTELADRPIIETDDNPTKGNRRPFHRLIPLKEILGELLETGPGSKKVAAAYCALIEKAGSELAILMDTGVGEIGRLKTNDLSGELLREAIDRMRRGEVSIKAGYDGEYGVIRVFPQTANFEDGPNGSLLTEGVITQRRRTLDSRDAKKTNNNSAPRTGGSMRLCVRFFEDKYTQDINFDSAQEAIINHSGERAVIIAGPGTGKTAVIAARIAKLVKDGAEPSSILALTFTVKAAASLRERVAGSGEVNTATFHSFCCGVLRDKAGEAGIPENFEIADESRRDELLREICKAAGGKTGPGKTGRYIEKRKRFLLLPGEENPATHSSLIIPHSSLPDMPPVPPPEPETEAIYALYRNRLRELNLLDYDDLIAGTVRLLASKPEILAGYRRRFRHIFVDEYQDINFSQYLLLRLLANGMAAGMAAPSLWVIGDPNQAIYGFRGSDKRFIDRFTVDYPDASRFELTRSFRCADSIISAAGRLSNSNLRRVSGEVYRMSPQSGDTSSELRGTDRPVDLYRTGYPSDKSEAEGVARVISRLIGGASFFAKTSEAGQDSFAGKDNYADTAAPGDCAVLIRAAPLAGPVVKALQDHGIPTMLDALEYSDSGSLGECRYGREGVHIMTIHAAKGLEFDHVFVIGLEDGILPFTLFGDDGKERIDEERRLLYVAMTRARIGLRLSWARSRNFKGRIINGNPSPFLAELEKIIPLQEEKRPVRKDNQMRLF